MFLAAPSLANAHMSLIQSIPPRKLELLAALARLTFDHMTYNFPGLIDSGGLSFDEEAKEIAEEFGVAERDNGRWARWSPLGLELLTEPQRAAMNDPGFKPRPDGFVTTFWQRKAHDRSGIAVNDPRPRPVWPNAEELRLLGGIVCLCREHYWEHGNLDLLRGFGIDEFAHGAFKILLKYGLIDVVSDGAVWNWARLVELFPDD